MLTSTGTLAALRADRVREPELGERKRVEPVGSLSQ